MLTGHRKPKQLTIEGVIYSSTLTTFNDGLETKRLLVHINIENSFYCLLEMKIKVTNLSKYFIQSIQLDIVLAFVLESFTRL